MRYAGNTPERNHASDAGLDLRANEKVVIPVGARRLVDTGLAVEVPPGHFGAVVPRSGLAAKHGVTVFNAPGVVDCGYTGNIKVNLFNDGAKPFEIEAGDRIAQLIIIPFADVTLLEVDSLEETERGANGFGSSGVK
ncbi:dUTP diphosphatase [Corynebacterium striatum]